MSSLAAYNEARVEIRDVMHYMMTLRPGDRADARARLAVLSARRDAAYDLLTEDERLLSAGMPPA